MRLMWLIVHHQCTYMRRSLSDQGTFHSIHKIAADLRLLDGVQYGHQIHAC